MLSKLENMLSMLERMVAIGLENMLSMSEYMLSMLEKMVSRFYSPWDVE